VTGVTLGSVTLNVSKIIEGPLQVIASQWESWSGGTAGVRKNVMGAYRTWVLECFEKDVSYGSDAYTYLRNQASAGTSVVLNVDLGSRFQAQAVVKVDDVDLTLDLLGTQNIRNFSVRIHETL
jgi:hypothetical protein